MVASISCWRRTSFDALRPDGGLFERGHLLRACCPLRWVGQCSPVSRTTSILLQMSILWSTKSLPSACDRPGIERPLHGASSLRAVRRYQSLRLAMAISAKPASLQRIAIALGRGHAEIEPFGRDIGLHLGRGLAVMADQPVGRRRTSRRASACGRRRASARACREYGRSHPC